ncbi:ABC transporter permease [Devosia albogilva]|uniref:ABC transporter permease n=1 Tax=Devosia albogilva TaxID=429726 RepID=A0ABW5QPM3_9HYPH
MKGGAYPAFALTAFQSRLAYRNQVWASAFGELVVSYAFIAIWSAAFAGRVVADGATLPQMITYVMVAGLLYWNTDRLINDVGDAVRTGDITIFLLKPLNYPASLLATHFGHYVFDQLVVTLPVFVIIGLTVGLLPPASMFHALVFIPYWALSWLMLFTLAALCGLLAFWLLTVFALEWFLKGIMALASGAIVPLWFMPGWLAGILGYLPFAWVSYYPSAIYLGKLDPSSAFLHFGIGAAWLAALLSFLLWLWSQARQRLTVQGG